MTFDEFLRLAQVVAIAASAALNLYLFRKSRGAQDRKAAEAQVKQLQDERRVGDSNLHKRIDAVSKFANDKNLQSFTRDMQLNKRISLVENTVAHMPTHADLTGIRSELADMNGNITALGERSKSNNEMLQSIQKHLMGLEQ
jgi:acyl CoA:acetate/3-ketoacid CoA transferase alpha subunit